MIYVYINGYDYNLDIFELIRAFFPDKEIINIEDLNQYTNGCLLDISLLEINDNLHCSGKFFIGDKLIAENNENLDDVYINRSRAKSIHIGIKKSIYKTLIKVVDGNLPWGILTGIRPIKIVHELIEKNTPLEEIHSILINQYLLSQDKAALIIRIAKKQEKYLYPVNSGRYSLYIGIPFCPTRCIYCSFPAMPIRKYSNLVDSYIKNLLFEIKNIKDLMKDKIINTVYIGGGTPTSIPLDYLKKIIEEVYNNFGQANIKEFTIEAGRPDTLNYEMLRMFKEMNVDRISINPQTMNDKTLRLIGRNHTSKDIIESYEMARKIGINNINMDLIVGLPGEGLDEIINTLNIVEELSPENVTVHTLALKKGSDFISHLNNYNLEDQKVIERMLDSTRDFAERNFYEPYYLYRQKNMLGNFENIGYAKDGYECIYNIAIMEEKETIIAAGVGSTSKVFYPSENRLERIFNFRDINEYIKRIDEVIERKKKILI